MKKLILFKVLLVSSIACFSQNNNDLFIEAAQNGSLKDIGLIAIIRYTV